MPTLVVDAVTRAKLAQFTEPVELLDEAGRPFGRFTPLPGPRPDRRQPQVSDDELDRREQEGGGRPLADILAGLERRG
jgi:hypothetical protein